MDCTDKHNFVAFCRLDAADPENVAKCSPGLARQPGGFLGRLGLIFSSRVLAPCAPRTVAEQYEEGAYSYLYCGSAGLSWSVPYGAGVLALGFQVRPDLAGEQMRSILFQSAYLDKIINPKEFIRMVKAAPVQQP